MTFQNLSQEIIFVAGICLSQLLVEFMLTGVIAITPTLVEAGVLSESQTTWPNDIYPLVLAALLMPFGQFADTVGPTASFIAGMTWFAAWSGGAGFTKDGKTLIVCRAAQGIGLAAALPAGLCALALAYEPGRRKNIVYACYSAMASLGALLGMTLAGIFSQFATWNWIFWTTCGMACLSIAGVLLTRPVLVQCQERRPVNIAGSILIASMLSLLICALTGVGSISAGQGITSLCITGTLSVLAGCVLWVEERHSRAPLLSKELLTKPHTVVFSLGLFLAYGTVGIYTLYAVLYMRDEVGIDPLQVALWFLPMLLGGCLVSILGGVIMHMVSGKLVLVFASVATIVSAGLWILLPVSFNYWAWIFPSMICATLGIDLIFITANAWISSQLPKEQQGLAGAVASTLLQFGVSFWLAVANIIVTNSPMQKSISKYTPAFALEIGLALASGLVFAFGVKMGKAGDGSDSDASAHMKPIGCMETTQDRVNAVV